MNISYDNVLRLLGLHKITKNVKLFMMLWYFIIKKARQQGQSSVRLIQCMLVKNVHRI